MLITTLDNNCPAVIFIICSINAYISYPFQLDYIMALPFVTPLINQFQLTYENEKSIIQNSIRGDNPIFVRR